MPSPVSADRSAESPEHGAVDALISQTRRLRGGIDAVRREAAADAEQSDDPRLRWQRALCELAAHHADNLGEHLDQLREGPPAAAPTPAGAPAAPVAQGPAGRAGSAEWNLLTDAATWSDELFRLFGRSPEDGALTLDELPSWLLEEDRPQLTAMVTDCLVDGRPIDGEFRIVRNDGTVRTVHMKGEPVLDADGCTASMWAVLRDVSALQRCRQVVHETHDSLQHQQHRARTEHRLAVELQEAVLPTWRGSLLLPPGPDPRPPAAGALDLAGHYLPSAVSTLVGGDWFDALHLPDGRTMLTVGGLTGHGVTATSGMAMLLGAVRGMAVAGTEPGPLMGWLNHLLDASAQPALGSALCCCYDPGSRTLLWSQAGHPAPLLFREGTARTLRTPAGVLLGAVADAEYAQARDELLPGDVLVLHTEGLSPDAGRLPALAPRFAEAGSAQECARAVLEEFGGREREDDACVLIARVGH
ncbi:PP2C family protein-serine/threonine phosphatase [Streptomyces morookaense]|uniref:SpoIIE family protein phosphatase n=1 Tax=Streptomyces morookaense TaxID=1970 RepID=A0A7Y7B297_STRMO|nr:SpoIIE family protein phosphatase [Streptomyces morookaense]NVK77721.1 SpoIIE family protein phosphatase [Streptomyces morookaense]GHF04988.1 hypothetical protein GCM10010359_02430 [Streptomyces morookaense]